MYDDTCTKNKFEISFKLRHQHCGIGEDSSESPGQQRDPTSLS